MRKLLMFLFFIGCNLVTSSTIGQSNLTDVVSSSASAMAASFKAGDYKKYISYVHPVLINASGGETRMIDMLNSQNALMKSKGVVISSITFQSPSGIVSENNELQCTISQHMELKQVRGRVVTYTTLIGISTDKGKTWKFIDASKMENNDLRKLYPKLSSKIMLPPKQKPTVYSS